MLKDTFTTLFNSSLFFFFVAVITLNARDY